MFFWSNKNHWIKQNKKTTATDYEKVCQVLTNNFLKKWNLWKNRLMLQSLKCNLYWNRLYCHFVMVESRLLNERKAETFQTFWRSLETYKAFDESIRRRLTRSHSRFRRIEACSTLKPVNGMFSRNMQLQIFIFVCASSSGCSSHESRLFL